MRRDPRSVNFVANAHLRTRFLARYMAAHPKKHKIAPPKKRRRPPSSSVARAPRAPKLPVSRPPLRREPPPSPKSAPKVEMKVEEPIPQKAPLTTNQIPEVITPREHIAEEPVPRGRERGAYD